LTDIGPMNFNSFAEYAPEPNPETNKKDVIWFALTTTDRCSPSAGSGPNSGVTAVQNPNRSPALTWSTASSDHAERDSRADPSEGHAGDPDT
jgi:hypothetical protein